MMDTYITVKINITRIVEADHYPGWVEGRLVDAWGHEWLFIEKAPVVADDLHLINRLPYPGVIACKIIDQRIDSDGREITLIDTKKPWGVESTDEITRFEILPEQIGEY